MKSAPNLAGGLLTLVSLLAGCAQPVADRTFTVRKIEAAPAGDGVVRVKLTTPGDMAEADESLLVNYVKIIAVRAATQRQRQVAEQRARATYRKMTHLGRSTKSKIRYLAVATEKSTEPRPQKSSRPQSRSVMLWDTYSQEIVGNNVYEVEAAPAIGSVGKFQTYSAAYIGAGL